MRTTRTTVAGLLAAVAFSTPATATPAVLSRQVTFAGGTVAGVPLCYATCRFTIEVRPGERFLHVATSAPAGVVALDVVTVNGAVRVCHDTAAGPLPIDGMPVVKARVVLDDAACGSPAPAGTVTAYFSDTAVTYADAVASAQDDPGRHVGGGL